MGSPDYKLTCPCEFAIEFELPTYLFVIGCIFVICFFYLLICIAIGCIGINVLFVCGDDFYKGFIHI